MSNPADKPLDGMGLAVVNQIINDRISQAVSAAGGGGFPTGGIIIWSGAATNIPDGWALCDGTNRTPDLRSRFVLGAGGGYSVGATGGEATHVLTVSEMPSHTHPLIINASGAYGGYSAVNIITAKYSDKGQSYKPTSSGCINSTGSSSAHNNMPPYYALCYIMKL